MILYFIITGSISPYCSCKKVNSNEMIYKLRAGQADQLLSMPETGMGISDYSSQTG
jgi:hypothetical protein